MTAAGTVSRSARALMVSRLLQPAVSLLVLLAIGRQSDLLLGQYAIATTFLFVLQTLPLMGLMPFVMREATRFPERVAPLFFTVGALAGGVALGINLVLQPALGLTSYATDTVLAVRMVGLAVAWGILAFLMEIMLVALHRTERVVAAAITEHGVRLLASGAVLYLHGGVAALIACALGARLVTLAMLGPVLWRQFQPAYRLRWSPELMRAIRRVLPAFLLSTILALVISRCDVFVLLSFRSTVEVGYYAIAYRMLEIALIAVSTVCTALFPRYAALFHANPEQHALLARRHLPLAVIALACGAFCCYLGADRYVALLFAKQYPTPVKLAQGFGFVLAVMGLNVWLSGLLNAIDRQELETRTQAIGALAYVAGLLLLVPPYGGSGALWSTVIAGALQAAARLRQLGRSGLSLGLSHGLALPAAAALAVFGLHYLLFAESAWYIQWPTGAAALALYLGVAKAGGLLPRASCSIPLPHPRES